MKTKYAKEIRQGVQMGLKFTKDVKDRKDELYKDIDRYGGDPGVSMLIFINGQQHINDFKLYQVRCEQISRLALDAYHRTANKGREKEKKWMT